MTARSSQSAKQQAKSSNQSLPSFKLLMPDGKGGTVLAAHVESGKTLVHDDALISLFRLLDYCACNNVSYNNLACTPEMVQADVAPASLEAA